MSGFSPVRQDTSGKFGCPVLSGLDTHMSSPVEPYSVGSGLKNFIFQPYGFDYLGFLTNARRGVMRSKTQWVFYRDLD